MAHSAFIEAPHRVLLSQSRTGAPVFHHTQSCLCAFNLMHQALRLTEIIDQISWHTDRDSLPDLALTCRTFEGPALDALWRNLPSLEPLINCIPTHLWGHSFQGELVSISYSRESSLSNLYRYCSGPSIPRPGPLFVNTHSACTPSHNLKIHRPLLNIFAY